MSRLHRQLSALPRCRLIAGPTPIERADRISEELGIELYIKRDDTIGLGAGGNKVRKLEFILGKAVAERVTTVMTTGGPQSNHARLTAAAAARLGLKCRLHLRGADPGDRKGNLLLDRIFGAEVSFAGDVGYDEVNAQMEALAQRLRGAGETPIIVPLGGATAEGTVGYVAGFAELLSQCTARHFVPDLIVLAAGTGSTQAGLVLGAALLAPSVRVAGVSASWSRGKLVSEIKRNVAEGARLLGFATPELQEIWIEDGYVGPGYATPSDAGQAALARLARSHGVLLDSTYTGKAMSGLIDLAERRIIAPDTCVVFLHTGGVPEIYARAVQDFRLQ